MAASRRILCLQWVDNARSGSGGGICGDRRRERGGRYGGRHPNPDGSECRALLQLQLRFGAVHATSEHAMRGRFREPRLQRWRKLLRPQLLGSAWRLSGHLHCCALPSRDIVLPSRSSAGALHQLLSHWTDVLCNFGGQRCRPARGAQRGRCLRIGARLQRRFPCDPLRGASVRSTWLAEAAPAGSGVVTHLRISERASRWLSVHAHANVDLVRARCVLGAESDGRPSPVQSKLSQLGVGFRVNIRSAASQAVA